MASSNGIGISAKGSSKAELSRVPLCVDLDGTLVSSDLLLESLVQLLKQRPWSLLSMPSWMLRGRAAFKAEVAARTRLNPELLPYNSNLLEWLELQHRSGRTIWLCTAANESVATSVADHLRIFDGVLASGIGTNLAGKHKAAQLEERFGYRGFDYCGNERRDIHVWKRARGAIVVGGDRMCQEAARHALLLQRFPAPVPSVRMFVSALRPLQWFKNALVLAPLYLAHKITEPDSLLAALLATTIFCLCASSTYVMNDLLELEADRTVSRQSQRPFASGDLSIFVGVGAVPLLLLSSLSLALFLPASFVAALCSYYVLAVVYSWVLKGRMFLDEAAITGLYTVRVVAGTAAIDVPHSPWLLSFVIPLFLALAFVRRFSQLRSQQLRTEQYNIKDVATVRNVGLVASAVGIAVLIVYTQSDAAAALFRTPSLLWLLCTLLLYWMAHKWAEAWRGQLSDDRLIRSFRDRMTWVVAIFAGAILYAAY